MSKKIVNHLNSEEIIQRLTDGESVRNVAAWLQEKHPKNKRLWISTVSLQKFRKEYLKLDGKVLKDIQEATQVAQKKVEEQQKLAQLESSNAYQDRINEIAGTHLDVARKIMQLDSIIEDRMSYWFNALKAGDATASQADKELRQYMDRQMVLLQQYKKFIEGMADHTVAHNINITVMNKQIGIMRDVIRDVMQELDPDTAIIFMDKLNSKINSLDYQEPSAEPVEGKVLNVIEAAVIDSGVDDD